MRGKPGKCSGTLRPLPVLVVLVILIGSASSLLAASAKLVVKNARLFTMAPQQRDPFTGYLVVAEDGTIAAVAAGDPPGNPVDAFIRAASNAGIPLAVMRDSFDGGREAYGHPLVLVRPDQYVAWVGQTAPRDVDALLRRVTGLPQFSPLVQAD